VEVLHKARFERFAIELPGTEAGGVSVPRAISTFLDAAASRFAKAEIIMLCSTPRVAELVAEIGGGDKRITVTGQAGRGSHPKVEPGGAVDRD
jgi:hypothetical protein